MPKFHLRGFTLVELLVVLSIISILSAIGLASFRVILQNSRDAKRQSDLKVLQSALEQYRGDQNFYPSVMSLSSSITLNSSTGNPSPPTNQKTYLNQTPTEPLSSRPSYSYSPLPAGCNNNSTLCSSYCLYASLENATSQIATCPDVQNYNLEVTSP